MPAIAVGRQLIQGAQVALIAEIGASVAGGLGGWDVGR